MAETDKDNQTESLKKRIIRRAQMRMAYLEERQVRDGEKIQIIRECLEKIDSGEHDEYLMTLVAELM